VSDVKDVRQRIRKGLSVSFKYKSWENQTYWKNPLIDVMRVVMGDFGFGAHSQTFQFRVVCAGMPF
jgi:hypothetical protein